MPRNNINRPPTIAMVLLLNEIFKINTNYGIPTVTELFVGAQIGIFAGFIQVPWKDPWDVCISVEKAYYKSDWKRLFMNALEHGDDWHLYYNMVSFLWKGRELELRMGSIRFFNVVVSFIVLTSCCYLGINVCIFQLTRDEWYLQTCAVGFSGVIFALKVLITHASPCNRQSLMGISIPSKYTYWVELFIIQMISPNASIIAHLSGILVGLMYVTAVTGPLRIFANFVDGVKNILCG